MLRIVKLGESKSGISYKKIDVYQNISLSFLTTQYLPWLCFILLLNKKNWKRPVILILILHYGLRVIANVFNYWIEIRPGKPNTIWPYTYSNWYFFYAPYNVLTLAGEIVGDWYPLLRTKAVTKDRKKIRIVTITCICYNLVKVFGMVCYFLDYPIDLTQYDKNRVEVNGTVSFKIRWWSTVAMIQVTSFFYDLSVIYALKKGLFDKLKECNSLKNSFVEKFKQISELRIIISMVASLIFLPIIIVFVFSLVKEFKEGKDPAKVQIDTQIDNLRKTVLSINFTFMYIDQILLRCYVERNQYRSKYSNKNKSSQNTSQYNYKKFGSIDNLSAIKENSEFKSILSPDSSIILNNDIDDSSSLINKRNINSNGNNESSYYINTEGDGFVTFVNENDTQPLNTENTSYNIDMSTIDNTKNYESDSKSFHIDNLNIYFK